MTQNRKKRSAAVQKKGASGRKKISWQKKQESWSTQKIVLLSLAAALIVIGGFFLQKTIMPAVRAGEAEVASTVRLNELVSDNHYAFVTDSGDVPDYIEITNTGDEAVNLQQYALMLDIDFNRMFSFPKYMLQPGECLLVCADGLADGDSHGDFSAPFKLSPSGGQNVILMNAQGQGIDSVVLPELDADAAYSRNADGSWSIGRATPGEDNASESLALGSGVQLEQGEVEISEAMCDNSLYFADERGLYHDYVELYNRSGEAVDLNGWYLSDDSRSARKWRLPELSIGANEYLVIHLSGLDRSDDPAHLHASFSLSSEGEEAVLSNEVGRVMDRVEFDLLKADVAYLRQADGSWISGAGTPGSAN